MSIWLLALVTFAQTSPSVKVHGYTKKNGTYVEPYKRTKGDKTRINNYSTKGNSNPYTGKKGYKSANK